jgi:hypothetical protein
MKDEERAEFVYPQEGGRVRSTRISRFTEMCEVMASEQRGSNSQ